MTNLTNYTPAASYPDLLTTTNNGQGLTTTLEPVQDGLGNSSPMQIATNAVNFTRAGNTFQLDGVALTATSAELNSLASGSTPGNFTVTNNLIVDRNLFVNGGLSVNRTDVAVTPYTVLQTDYIIAVTVNVAGVSIVLPAPSPGIYQVFVVKDEVGNAFTQNITITADGGALIDGAAAGLLDVNYDSTTIYSNGTNYFTI